MIYSFIVWAIATFAGCRAIDYCSGAREASIKNREWEAGRLKISNSNIRPSECE